MLPSTSPLESSAPKCYSATDEHLIKKTPCVRLFLITWMGHNRIACCVTPDTSNKGDYNSMATYPDGTLLTASGPEVDRMQGGQRRWIPDPPTFTCMGLNWGAIQTISDSEWDQIPKGAPYPSRADATLLQGSGPQVYVMAGCQRHLIPDADLTAIAEGVQLPSVHTAGQYALNGGGGWFLGDQFFSAGGGAASNAASVDTSGVINPAPQAVYQSERVGVFTYTIPYLIPARKYTVRLHFNEFVFSQPGQRIFNVSINGTPVLSDFDIVAQAGGRNKAIVEEFKVTASSDGQITIQFGPARVDLAKVSGIEVIEVSPI